MGHDVSCFGIAQKAIIQADALRIVGDPGDGTGTDLQGHYEGQRGGYWLLLVTFPESLYQWPCEDCGDCHARVQP